MTAMAASIGANPDLVRVEVIRVDRTWHRRVKLGAFDYWRPEACQRAGIIEETRSTPPVGGVMCEVCWPVWPAEGRR